MKKLLMILLSGALLAGMFSCNVDEPAPVNDIETRGDVLAAASDLVFSPPAMLVTHSGGLHSVNVQFNRSGNLILGQPIVVDTPVEPYGDKDYSSNAYQFGNIHLVSYPSWVGRWRDDNPIGGEIDLLGQGNYYFLVSANRSMNIRYGNIVFTHNNELYNYSVCQNGTWEIGW